jgi:hypothetical protein
MISLGNILLSSPSSLVEIVYICLQNLIMQNLSIATCRLIMYLVTIWVHHIPALIINFIDSIVLWNIPLFMEQPRSPLHRNILLLVYY